MDWYFHVFSKYADFSGRARRQELWIFLLVNLLLAILLAFADKSFLYVLGIIYGIIAFIPFLAVSVRRLHDAGFSGWLLLIGLIPWLGNLALLILFALDSQQGNNQYGPDPRQQPAPGNGNVNARIARLEARIGYLEHKLGIVPPAPVAQPEAAPPRAAASEPATPRRPAPETVKTRPAAVTVPSQTRPTPRRENWEQKIGGVWLNRIGVVALLIGLAFFLKYAFDSNWVNETGRILIGYLAGFVFAGAGFWYRRKGRLPVFASGLGGAGIGAWYVTTWFAYNVYALFGQVPAFAVMIAVTVAAVGLALYWNSPGLVGLALLGGYLTPLLVSGEGSFTGLFSYLLFLNAGSLAVMVRKNWHALAFISLGFTAVLFGVSLNIFDYSGQLLPFMLYLTAFHLLFALMGLAANLVHRKPTGPPVLGIAVVSGIVYAVYSGFLLFENHPFILAAVLAAWGLFYLGQMAAVARWRNDDSNLAFVLLCLGLAYTTLAAPMALSGTWITMAWTVMSMVLILAGWKAGHLRYRAWGLLIQGLALFRLVFLDMELIGYWYGTDYVAPWAERLPALLLAVAAMLATAWLYKGLRVSRWEQNLVPWLVAGANILVLAFVLLEWSRWFYYLGSVTPDYNWAAHRATVWTLTMAANLSLLLLAWRRWQYKPLQVLILVLLPLAMLWSLLADIGIFARTMYSAAEYASPWLGRLPAALLLAALAFLAVRLFGADSKASPGLKRNLSWLAVAANGLVLAAGLKEFDRYFSQAWESLTYPWQVYRNTAWSALMAIHGFSLVALGIWRKMPLYRRLGIGFLLVTVAKILLVDLTGLETIWRILVFAGTGALLILASWLYQKFVSALGEEKGA